MKKKLRYFECNDYKIIPLELVEQLRGEEWTQENFIKYQESMKNNPNYFLFLLVNAAEENKIVGFFCGVIDEIRRSFFIRGLSVLPEYQGGIIPFTKRFMEMLIRKSKGYLKNVYWTTDKPKAYEKHGFYSSKNKIMSLYKES